MKAPLRIKFRDLVDNTVIRIILVLIMLCFIVAFIILDLTCHNILSNCMINIIAQLLSTIFIMYLLLQIILILNNMVGCSKPSNITDLITLSKFNSGVLYNSSITKNMQFALLYMRIKSRISKYYFLFLLYYVLYTICLILLFAISAKLLCYYYNDFAFRELCYKDSLLTHVYYIVTTILTIGYGDFYAANIVSQVFMMIVGFTNILLLIIGVSIFINLLLYVPDKLCDILSKIIDQPNTEIISRKVCKFPATTKEGHDFS